MHRWHSNSSTNILQLIDEFIGFEFETDYNGREEVSNVKISYKTFTDGSEARNFVTNSSYGTNTAWIAAYTDDKVLKGYSNAFTNFIKRRDDYLSFKKDLTIAYGRKSNKATCPNCGSSINLAYGKKFKECPVCNSKKIISDSNWASLETKHNMMVKAGEVLQREAIKSKITFVCGIEWHC